jgi:hypothetical protein
VIFNYSPTLYLLYMYKLLHFNLIFPQVFGALRMSVKMLLMWNSRMEIDGGGDSIVATSLLDASNLIVLKVSSWSNVNYCFSILLLVLSMHNYCSYVFRNHL